MKSAAASPIDSSSFLAHDVVAHHASRTPGAIALANADTGREYTWAELEWRVARCAAVMRSEYSISPGDRVAVVADNDPRMIEVQFACMRLDAIFVPLNWRLAHEELAYQCADADVSLVVHDATWADQASQLAQARDIQTLSWGSDGSYEALIEGARPFGAEPKDWDTPTHILYTSGTTGRPKGALSSRRSLTWQAINIAGCDEIACRGAHHLNPMPLFHAGGLNVITNPILFFGGRVSTMAKFDPERIMRLVGDKAYGVSHFAAIPTMYNMLASVPEFDATDYSHVRHAICAGAVAPVALLERWAAQGCPLEPQFGGTETGPTILQLDARDLTRSTAGIAGSPVHHTEVRLVDPVTELDVAEGQVGELWVRGPSITPGYWNRDRDEFFTDGYFRTGDALRRDQDGFYSYAGRFKDMYKSGGENVYAAEVETVIQAIAGVAEVAIIGVPDDRWGEVGLAVIVPADGASIDLATIARGCDGRLARYKIPKRLQLVDSLPRNVTGKVSKADLRAAFGVDANAGSA
jgi:fatty-acyl-CoA synthase